MAGVAKHRHAVDTGYARGEETRGRIVTAALQMFGQRGFEAASTRDIATLAGVNAPALQYYFDSKEGLFVACVEHIVKRVWEYLSEPVERAKRALEERAEVEQLIECFCAIQDQLAHFMFTTKDKDDWRLFMARIQAGEGPAAGFEIAYKNISCHISDVTSGIVGRLLGRPAADEETLVRTAALSGTLMVFQMSRRSVMMKLGWDKIDADRLALLQRVNREHTRVLLRSMVAGRLARRPARVRHTPAEQKRKMARN
jgi:TetR/AcrR family transcriptional regulator, regulator of cefoperazone and chloramphenicol sensitivity